MSWTKICDGYPPIDEIVLVSDGEDIDSGSWNKDEIFDFQYCDCCKPYDLILGPTYWMPMPELPKVEK